MHTFVLRERCPAATYKQRCFFYELWKCLKSIFRRCITLQISSSVKIPTVLLQLRVTDARQSAFPSKFKFIRSRVLSIFQGLFVSDKPFTTTFDISYPDSIFSGFNLELFQRLDRVSVISFQRMQRWVACFLVISGISNKYPIIFEVSIWNSRARLKCAQILSVWYLHTGRTGHKVNLAASKLFFDLMPLHRQPVDSGKQKYYSESSLVISLMISFSILLCARLF